MCSFDDMMDAKVCVKILDRCLLPFRREVHPDGHRFMLVKDPEHASRRAHMNWWKAPIESPDLRMCGRNFSSKK